MSRQTERTRSTQVRWSLAIDNYEINKLSNKKTKKICVNSFALSKLIFVFSSLAQMLYFGVNIWQ